jgi:BlaI family penicillinase repressor
VKQKQKHHLASLQLAIMDVLWERNEATVAEVREALKKTRPLAHTTVGTMLAKMERNGQVRHRTDGKANIYRPTVQKEKVRRSMVADLRLGSSPATSLKWSVIFSTAAT